VGNAIPPVEPEGLVMKARLLAQDPVDQEFPTDSALELNAAAVVPSGGAIRSTATRSVPRSLAPGGIADRA
jgi:hypothetical protein